MIFAVLILFPFIFFTNREVLKVNLRGLAYFSLRGNRDCRALINQGSQ